MLSGPGRRPVAEDVMHRVRPIPPDVAEELEKLRTEKEAATGAGDFERAANLGARERKLTRDAGIEAHHRVVGDRLATYAAGSVLQTRLSIVLGVLLATIAFPLGLLVGWLVWGIATEMYVLHLST